MEDEESELLSNEDDIRNLEEMGRRRTESRCRSYQIFSFHKSLCHGSCFRRRSEPLRYASSGRSRDSEPATWGRSTNLEGTPNDSELWRYGGVLRPLKKRH